VFSNRLADCHPGTAFTDTTARAGAVLYRIRSIKREVVRSGSYTNLGHGRFVKISADHQVNRPPVVSNRLGAVVAGQAIVLTLAGNDPDGDPIRFALADWPATGLLTGCPPHLVYQSVPDTTGTVVFTYDASDGVADSDPATITLTLAPVHTRRGTPGAWLIATIGFTNDYEQADADDPDGDRQPTWMEYRAGTDPRDSRSRFTILSLDRWEGSNRIRWYGTTNSGAHTPFTLDRTESLATVDWRAIATNLPRHPSGTNTWFDTNQTSRAFYRIFIP